MKTTADIITNATERADEITRVFSANARKATDAAAIVANILQNAKTSKNVDRLFEFAATATAAALAADEANHRGNTSQGPAYSYLCSARRSAAAYKAAATRAAAKYPEDYNAGVRAEAIAKRDAAAEALAIIEDAYNKAMEMYANGNRAFNAAVRDAREVVRFAKLAAAAEQARRSAATDADALAYEITRSLDARTKDIDAAAKNFRIPFDKNERIAEKVAAYVLADAEEQAKQDERSERSAKLATTRTRHMNIGEKKQQARTIDGADGWTARVSYAPQVSNHITHDWRVDVYHNDIYICHDLFYTVEEAEKYAEAMTAEPKHDDGAELASAICTTAPGALLDAYADAIGERPTKDDPEHKAAYRVAISEAFNDPTAAPAPTARP